MKKFAIALSTALVLLLGLPKTLVAQNAQTNLWFNGGFEQKEKNDENTPLRWSINGHLTGTKTIVTDNPHEGTNCIQLYPRGAHIGLWDEDWDWDQKYDAKDGDTFTLSYWHRGTLKTPTLKVQLRYYTTPASKKNEYSAIGDAVIDVEGSEVVTSTDWKQHEVSFTIDKNKLPANVRNQNIASFDIKLYLPSNTQSGDQSIFLDDFSLIKGAPAPKVVAPVTISTTIYEREAVLSWSNAEGTTWEVMVNNQTHQLNTPKYTLTDLTPNTNYTVKVAAIKGGSKSAYRDVSFKTDSPSKADNEETRLPYLATLRPDGTATKMIDLFYLDLYKTASTKFTYWVDDVVVQPNGHQLTFPKAGRQVLKIKIEEGSDKVWTLVYNVNVSE